MLAPASYHLVWLRLPLGVFARHVFYVAPARLRPWLFPYVEYLPKIVGTIAPS